jgi:hypothetical protein
LEPGVAGPLRGEPVMPNGIDAELVSLQQDEKPPRFSVHCPYCHATHDHRWFGRDVSFDVTAPCSTGSSVRRYLVRLDSVDRDDNAIDVPVPNWEE